MCTCFTGYFGNDCALRTCPYAPAFVTTPQGDLNVDGDLYDNSYKLLVKAVDGSPNTATMMETDDILTLSQSIVTNELQAGDAIMVGGETFLVDAQKTSTTFVSGVANTQHATHQPMATSWISRPGRFERFMFSV